MFGNSRITKKVRFIVVICSVIACVLVGTGPASAIEEARKAVWLSDLSKCVPADVISRDVERGKWIAVDYEVQEGKGVMLFALPGSKARPLTLKLNATGWYQVRLGFFYGAFAGGVQNRILCAKLSKDAAFSRFGLEDIYAKDGNYPEKTIRWFDIAEVFWKSADLTGQDLIIAAPDKGVLGDKESNLSYVRLVPMDESAVKEWNSEQPTEKTKKLIATYDGGSFAQWGISTKQDFLAEFQCLRDSDFDIALYTMAYGPTTFYPSKVGEFARPIEFYEPSWHWGIWTHKCVENGLNPFTEAIAAAHACGVKLFAQNRFGGPQVPPYHIRTDHGGKFMAEHPEWMATYADGEPTRHLSFAFKGVRDFYVRLFREWVEDYRADGINMVFSRSYPFVYYEEPVCKAFEKQYGEDMRKLPISDKRVHQVRADFVTQFLKEIREMLDEVGKAQGRYIPSCYTVPVHNTYAEDDWDMSGLNTALKECMFNALDVESWIKQGLVDYLDVVIHMFGEHDGRGVQSKVREFTELAKGTKTKVYINIYPRRMPPRKYRQIAMSYYDAGADGMAFWDSMGRYLRASEWAFIKRLGHRDDLKRWEGKGDDYFRKIPLKRLDGFIMERVFSRPTDG